MSVCPSICPDLELKSFKKIKKISFFPATPKPHWLHPWSLFWTRRPTGFQLLMLSYTLESSYSWSTLSCLQLCWAFMIPSYHSRTSCAPSSLVEFGTAWPRSWDVEQPKKANLKTLRRQTEFFEKTYSILIRILKCFPMDRTAQMFLILWFFAF